MSEEEDMLWVAQVLETLKGLLEREGIPRLNIEWLILRCEDTFGYQYDLRSASVTQLFRDVSDFDVEFPGLLPSALLMGRELTPRGA